MNLGFRELLIILVLAMVVFGTKKIRSIGSDLGGAVRDFKKAMDGGETAQNTQTTQTPPSPPPPQLHQADAQFHAQAAAQAAAQSTPTPAPHAPSTPHPSEPPKV